MCVCVCVVYMFEVFFPHFAVYVYSFYMMSLTNCVVIKLYLINKMIYNKNRFPKNCSKCFFLKKIYTFCVPKTANKTTNGSSS